jgi:hypothetical protein
LELRSLQQFPKLGTHRIYQPILLHSSHTQHIEMDLLLVLLPWR